MISNRRTADSLILLLVVLCAWQGLYGIVGAIALTPPLATVANVARFEARRAELEKAANELLSSAQARAAAFEGYKLTLTAKAGNEGKLFGSIGTSDIAEAANRDGKVLERAEVRMPNGPLRTVGEHVVAVHLHTDVDVELQVLIVADEPG